MPDINFDHAAAAPVLDRARAAMQEFLEKEFGNPSSLHQSGERPRQALETARAQVAALVNARPEEIVFTASGSESNNLAVKGLALAQPDKGRHIVVSAIEHASVLESARALARLGFEVTEVPVDGTGTVRPEKLRAAIRPDTVLVSVMHANNEVGTIQNLMELTRTCCSHKVLFHSDGCAAVGRVPVDIAELGVDAYSFAAQSVYGPRGAAALCLRRGVRIRPLVDGGVQERNRRAGTENVAAVAGFGVAAEFCHAHINEWSRHMARLSRRILTELPERLKHVVLTGCQDHRLPGHASMCVEFVEGEAMLLFLDDEGIRAASGSSCTARNLKASHVLLAMGLPHALAQSSLMLTLGRDSTDSDVDYFLDKLPGIVERLRRMSPLYARFQRGEDPYQTRPGQVCEEHEHTTEEN
ncbi:cysteine desulfurase [candidate division WOR-3 bacterium]|nr:cysteine desulfurase [candidate division WOR-3 bacterium]